MKKALLIVESPAKARTISKYLGGGFVVESSIGHVRDLPSTASEIPARFKGEPWARLGVDVDRDFKPVYIVPAGKKTQVRKLKDRLKEASELYLATDVDREGEAIAWHLLEVLRPKCPVKRMTFEEITRSAILKAVDKTRDIDRNLVNAQETRRILDRLYGYEVSPLLWRKVRPKLSAGRVQSVATRLIVERERKRIGFVKGEYWGVTARLKPHDGPEKAVVESRLVELGGRRVASGKDFDDETGRVKVSDSIVLLDAGEARALAEELEGSSFSVLDVAEKRFTRQPYPPFITSTLQQEAARKLRFSARHTMRVAQTLYENGYITYMRTDSTQLSSQAVGAARAQVEDLYGKDFLPPHPRIYKKKSKNAQEAHEAIRPAGETFRLPRSVAGELDRDAFRLYELIWKRTVASQMKDARGMRTQVRIGADGKERGEALFAASGRVVTFPGFLRAYVEGLDDPSAELGDKEKVLPPLERGMLLDPLLVEASGHETQPPPRYTEATLIRELEERGIGRPSTYASIIQTIQDRGYVWRKGTALVPTFTAFAVIRLLETHMPHLVDYDFTARMEDELDAIAGGLREPVPWLRAFYFGGGKEEREEITGAGGVGLKALVRFGGGRIDAREVSRTVIGSTKEGEEVVVRVGRFGAYVQIGEDGRRAPVADDIPPDELSVERALELVEASAMGERLLGKDPASGKPVYVRTGRFGPYVQLGDPELTEKGRIKRGTRPKMAGLWPKMSVETVTLEEALLLLSFPREVGVHPETGVAITAQDGRFGPYLKMGDETRSLPDHEALSTISLEEAVALFKEPKKARRGKRTAVLFELGDNPEGGKSLKVAKGRYGPYVTDGEINASLPKGRDPASVTVEEAAGLLEARRKKLEEGGKAPRRRAAKKGKARRGKGKEKGKGKGEKS